MFRRVIRLFHAGLVAIPLILSVHAAATADGATVAGEDGIVKVRSVYAFDETLARLKQDVADKGIMLFMVVDQAKLAAASDIKLRPSSLMIFGNPGLGAQFMTSNPIAGLDWPVRLLVTEAEDSDVWLAYSDFGYISRRHGIEDRDAAFAMATKVILSIASSVQAEYVPLN